MRKGLALAVLVAAMLLLVGCTTANNAEADVAEEVTGEVQVLQVEALNLDGNWVQKTAEDGVYKVVHIEGETVEICTVNANFELESVLWQGSYKTPVSATSNYKWVSMKAEGENANSTYTDGTITFQYKNGVLTFTTAENGNRETVSLVKTENTINENM